MRDIKNIITLLLLAFPFWSSPEVSAIGIDQKKPLEYYEQEAIPPPIPRMKPQQPPRPDKVYNSLPGGKESSLNAGPQQLHLDGPTFCSPK